MNKIQAVIVADSIDPRGNRITSFLLTYPRFIHSELMTHRMFSRNSASSRAIPFEKMVKMVEEDPFIPIVWQKDHKGMQGSEYFTDAENIEACINKWLEARDCAIEKAKELNEDLGYGGVTKQLCNRLLEPFMWHTTLVTATEFDNFLELRCPKYEYYIESYGEESEIREYFKSKKDMISKYGDVSIKDLYNTRPRCTIKEFEDIHWLDCDSSQAEIHIQALAESMWDAMNESKPKELEAGEWHIPDFGLHKGLLEKYISDYFLSSPKTEIKIAVAHCAKLSYNNHGNSIDFAKDIKLYNQLLASHHMSPFEHVAVVATDNQYRETYIHRNNNYEHGWFNNFRGFIPYRYLIENEKI